MILSSVAWLSVAVWVVLVGLGVLRSIDRERRGWDAELPPALLAGWLTLHLGATTLQWAGVPWDRRSLSIAACTMLVPALWIVRRSTFGRAHRAPTHATRAVPFADLASAALVLGMVWVTLAMRSPFTDFVYHWGLKAERFALAGGVDWRFLEHPAMQYTHPDYPFLWSELFALPAILAGRFDERVLMLWTPLCLAGIVLEVRYRLGRHLDGTVHGLALLCVLVPITGFAIGHLQVGAADLPLLLALLVGVGSLQDNSAAGASVRVGIASAVAAALKIEGVALGLLLVALTLLRHRRALTRPLRRAVLLVLPSAAVVAPWALALRAHHLFQPNNRGPLRWGHWHALLTDGWRVVWQEEWRGLPLLLLFTPLLLRHRHSRWIGVVVLSGLVFYTYLFLSTPVDASFLVLSALPRLLLHLVPLALLGILLAAAYWPSAASLGLRQPTLESIPAPEGE